MGRITLKFDGLPGQYVVGLAWRHEDKNPGKGRLKELSTIEGRWGIVRKTAEGKFQAGFCEPLNGIKPKLLKSLADIIADTTAAPWRGTYDLGDGRYWYIAVAEGNEMLPDGDCVVSGADLPELRRSHDGYAHWREVEFSESDLVDLIASVQGKAPLRDLAPNFGDLLSFSRRTWVAIGTASAVVAAGVGLAVLKRNADEMAAAEAAAVQRAAAAAAKQVEAEKAGPPPWQAAPSAGNLFTHCRDLWRAQQLAVPGWVLASWTCTAGAQGVEISEDWAIDGGRAQNVPGTVMEGGQTATAFRKSEFDWPRLATEGITEILSIDSAQRRAWDISQRFGIALSMAKASPSKRLFSDSPPYIEIGVTFSLPVAPWLGFATDFDDIPGMRISSLRLDMHTETWTVNGRLYAAASANK